MPKNEIANKWYNYCLNLIVVNTLSQNIKTLNWYLSEWFWGIIHTRVFFFCFFIRFLQASWYTKSTNFFQYKRLLRGIGGRVVWSAGGVLITAPLFSDPSWYKIPSVRKFAESKRGFFFRVTQFILTSRSLTRA